MTEKQNKPLFTEEDTDVTKDLTKKVAHDVIDLIYRTLEISPPPPLPIIMGAGVGVVGYLAHHLESESGVEDPEHPDRKSILLSALLVAYTIIHNGDHSKIIVSAMDACDLLIKKGMV